MDVTSMLNSGAAAAAAAASSQAREARESSDVTPTPSVVDGTTVCSSVVQTPSPERTPSRRTSGSRTPNRSRTPWDAGGYSLPLTLDTKSATQAMGRPSFYNDSPIDSASPKSPKHKFSDSHSSLSSYSSSVNSVSHSRFSSLSTVSGGFQTLGSVFTDLPALDTRSCDNLDSAVSRASVPEFWNKKPRKDGGLSPSAIAEEPSLLETRRPGSPSDAMLISRGSQGSDRMSPQEASNPNDLKSDSNYLVLPDLFKSQHKRAISAPDFAAISAIDQPFQQQMPQNFQPTPPLSQQGDRRASYTMETPSVTPATTTLNPVEEDIKCMYVDNCDTGSQPRKAISHIFGRNKLCTRSIPAHVWVHFCRKHYQRSRYRNAQEYSKLQCELVQKQIARVQAWSDDNKRNGKAGVVQDWSLSVRKREQKRLDERNSSGRKRPFRDESEEDGDVMEPAVLNGTAVPAWLLNKCSSGYSTAQIEEIVARLKSDMVQGTLTQIPDIEILPNITVDSTDDGKSKIALKRKTSTGNSHKRSQSVGVALRHDSIPMMRRVSQPNFTGGWRPEDSLHSSPIEKRQRIADFPSYGMGDRHNPMGLAQVPERAVPTMRHIQHLPHRPAFSHIRENQTMESYFDDESARNAQYSYGGPLPAPTPQRHGGQPMAAQLESNSASQGYLDARRPMHQRSHSEMGTFHHNPSMNYRTSSSMGGFPGAMQNYGTEPMSYDGAYMRPEAPFGSSGPPGYYDDTPMSRQYAPQQQAWGSPSDIHSAPYAQPRHTRHQSTSAVPQVGPRVAEGDHRLAGPFQAQPQHRRQHSFATRNVQYRSMEESEQTKAMYVERR